MHTILLKYSNIIKHQLLQVLGLTGLLSGSTQLFTSKQLHKSVRTTYQSKAYPL
jgi:hypothetical protein